LPKQEKSTSFSAGKVGSDPPPQQGLEHQRMSEDQYTAQIEGGQAELIAPDPDAPGLLQIRMSLEPLADPTWCAIFNVMPPGRAHALDIHPPEAGPTEIKGKTPDSSLEDYVAQIRERLSATNDHYNETVAAQLKAEAEERESERELEERRLEEARRKLENV
jgi:hypothetical protein